MRYTLTVDLVDDPALIAEYEEIHKKIWPEIEVSILDADIVGMDIYRYGNRLFMIMDVGPNFTFEKKEAMDKANPIVQKWETMLWKYQQALPGAKEGEKWKLMDQIFSLK
jgi:L-rhamnose mutarotase